MKLVRDADSIRSFKSNFYIAPLQENLLRGAPNSSMSKWSTLKVESECRWHSSGKKVKFRREVIPGRGPTTENVWFCLVEVRAKGIGRRLCWDQGRPVHVKHDV